MKIKVTQKQRIFFEREPKPKEPMSAAEIAERDRLIAKWLEDHKIKKLEAGHAVSY